MNYEVHLIELEGLLGDKSCTDVTVGFSWVTHSLTLLTTPPAVALFLPLKFNFFFQPLNFSLARVLKGASRLLICEETSLLFHQYQRQHRIFSTTKRRTESSISISISWSLSITNSILHSASIHTLFLFFCMHASQIQFCLLDRTFLPSLKWEVPYASPQ